MAKRMGFHHRAPRSKVPRLDISIVSSQRITTGPSQTLPDHEQNAPAQSDDMWGSDEDDEFIMLASQAAEKVEANHEMAISQAMNARDLDMSYGMFRREVKTSTQKNSAIDNFMEDDDDILSNVDLNSVVKEAANKPSTSKEYPKQPNVFAVPAAPAPCNEQAKKLEKAKSDTQHTFMAEKLKAQKREIDTLKENLAKLTEKCQTKEGEASTLRYELEHNKQQCSRIRKEKMSEIAQLEREHSEKITNMEKTIETQRAQIEFKNMEIISKKTRKSLNDSTFHEQEALPEHELQSLFRIPGGMSSSNTVNSTVISYLTVNSMNPPKQHSDRFNATLNNLHALQTIHNNLKFTKQADIDVQTRRQISVFVTELIWMLRSYVGRLELHQANKYNPLHEFQRISGSANITSITSVQLSSTATESVHQEKPMAGEKLIYERQMLAVIALLCDDFKSFATSILLDKIERLPGTEDITDQDEDAMDVDSNGDQTFVDMLAEILCTIGFSKTLSAFKGFVVAASLLLNALAQNYTPSEKTDASLHSLFKSINFCQPDLESLNILSKFLETISNSSDFCNKLCSNQSNNITYYPRFNIKKFSFDTCPLQIYASLLEIAFEPYEQKMACSKEMLVVLTDIIVRMVTFLRNCFKRPVDWLFRRVERENAQDICHCWCRVVACTIILLHLFIKNWIEDQKCVEVKRTEVVFKIGALFLYDNFHKFYETKVLQLGGFPVKNRLQAIYDWISRYHDLFSFSEAQTHAIQTVNLRRISLLNEPQRMPESQLRSQSDVNPENECPILMSTLDTLIL